jgi:putative efflux ABC transporter, permease protein
MEAAWRAWLAVRRKWVRSLALLLIMGIIFAALVAGAVVRKSTNDLKETLNKNFHAGFTLRAGRELIKDSEAQKILKVQGVEKANFRADELLDVTRYKLVEGGEGGVTLDRKEESQTLVASFISESAEIEEFLNGKYEMIKGRGISDGAENEVLIHEEFATLNRIQVGDEIEVGLYKKKLKLKVVGVFSGKDSQQTFRSEMIENRFFVGIKTLGQFKKNLEYQQVKYLVSDPKQVEEVTNSVKKLELNWKELSLENNFAKKKAIYQTIENVEKLLVKILIGVSVMGGLILGFVLLFWFRGRIHEIGTLLAIGKTKMNIFWQMLIELIIIATLSFGPAIFLGNLSAGVLTEKIMSEANPDQSGNTTDVVLSRKQLDLFDYLGTYMCGGAVIFLAVSGASISVMRLKPKAILTKMK